MTLPTPEQAKHLALAVGDGLGALFTLCTLIGNPLAKLSTGKLSAFGHLVLAFGADLAKARKRITELFAPSEPS